MRDDILDTISSPDYIIRRTMEVHESILATVNEQSPEQAFARIWTPRGHEKRAIAAVDLIAEWSFRTLVAKDFDGEKNVVVLGEESIQTETDLSNETRICMLVDMIDGTDLLERGFSNWCSAIAVFRVRPQNRIEGAFVVRRSERHYSGAAVYYATSASPGAFMREISRDRGGRLQMGEQIALSGPEKNKNKRLQDASVCTYVQRSNKILRLLELSEKHPQMYSRLVAWLRSMEQEDRKRRSSMERGLGFRFYSLAGNPMIARLAEGVVDVVFEADGQHPHDVVPGAYIALKAGADMIDLANGRAITEEDLAEKLIRPGAPHSELRYVISAGSELRNEIIELLMGDRVDS